MNGSTKVKSPLGLRMLIWTGTILFGLLVYWLLGFVLSDVGKFRKVDYAEIERRIVGDDLFAQRRQAEERIETLAREIAAEEEKQSLFKNLADTSRNTMQQMLDAQTKRMERNEAVEKEQKEALAQAQTEFLKNQNKFAAQAEVVLTQNQAKRDAEFALRRIQRQIAEKRQNAQDEFRRENLKRQIQAASLKVLFLLPVIALSLWLTLRKRRTLIAPVVYALDAAVLWKLIQVIHEHFPREVYKYIFIAVALLVVLKALIHFLRSAATPSLNLLIKRYREAYRRNQCAICGYPIVHGSLHLAETARRMLGKKVRLSLKASDAQEETEYTCPSCGQKLFEACPSCRQIRHALLPSCQHCGQPKELPGA